MILNTRTGIIGTVIFLVALTGQLTAHPGGHGAHSPSALQTWTDQHTGAEIFGSLLYVDQEGWHSGRIESGPFE